MPWPPSVEQHPQWEIFPFFSGGGFPKSVLCYVTSAVSDSATLWTVACQAPLFRQEYWSGLPCPPPGDLPDPGKEPSSLVSPALPGRFFNASATWEAVNLMEVLFHDGSLKSLCAQDSKHMPGFRGRPHWVEFPELPLTVYCLTLTLPQERNTPPHTHTRPHSPVAREVVYRSLPFADLHPHPNPSHHDHQTLERMRR